MPLELAKVFAAFFQIIVLESQILGAIPEVLLQGVQVGAESTRPT